MGWSRLVHSAFCSPRQRVPWLVVKGSGKDDRLSWYVLEEKMSEIAALVYAGCLKIPTYRLRVSRNTNSANVILLVKLYVLCFRYYLYPRGNFTSTYTSFTSMHSTLIRAQNVFGFFTTVAFCTAILTALSVLLANQEPSAKIELRNVQM